MTDTIRVTPTKDLAFAELAVSPKHTLTSIIVQTLKDNELIRKLIPEVQGSLMKAISDQLFFSSGMDKQIQESCVKLAENLLSLEHIPLKLKTLITTFDGYKADPSNHIFDTLFTCFLIFKLNLELVSLGFKKRVILYSVSKEFVLKAQVFNNRYKKTIRLINTSGHYDSIYREEDLQAHSLCQNILYEILDSQELHLGSKIDDELINIDYENYLEDMSKEWVEDKPEGSPERQQAQQQNIILTNSSETKRKHKRSMSDSINTPLGQDDQRIQDFGEYSLFENRIPPGLFDKILSFERRNSIVESIRIKKSTTISSSSTSNRQSISAGMISQNTMNTLNTNLNVNSTYTQDGTLDNKQPTSSSKRNEVDSQTDSSQFSQTPGKRMEPVKNRIVYSNNQSSENSDSEEDEQVENKGQTTNNQEDIHADGQVDKYDVEDDLKLIKEAGEPNTINNPLGQSDQASVVSSSNYLPSPNALFLQSNILLTTVNPLHLSPRNSLLITENQESNGSALQKQLYSSLGYQQNQLQSISEFNSISNTNNNLNRNNLQYPSTSLTSTSTSTVVPLSNSISGDPFPVDTGDQLFRGKLKFFNSDKNFGFIVEETSGQDVFVHFEDLQKAGIPRNYLLDTRHGKGLRFQFQMMEYLGKYNRSRKAVNIQVLSDQFPFQPIPPNPLYPSTSAFYMPPQNFLNPGQLINPNVQRSLSPSSPSQIYPTNPYTQQQQQQYQAPIISVNPVSQQQQQQQQPNGYFQQPTIQPQLQLQKKKQR